MKLVVSVLVALCLSGACRRSPERPTSDAAAPPSAIPHEEEVQPMTADPDRQLRDLAEKALDELGAASRGWSVATSPAFPTSWPPDGKVFVYVYAYGFAQGVADGSKTGDVFARIEMTSAGMKLELLASRIGDLGIQGVRPVMRDAIEKQRVGLVNARAALLAAHDASGLDRRAFADAYCAWRASNGVVAASIEKRHPAFFAWLACST